MNVNDVLDLVRAGFTANQIAAMAASSSDPAPDPAVDPATEPEPAPEPEPTPAPEPASAGLDPAAVMAELLGIKQAIQAGNINNPMPGGAPDPAAAVDNILATIINPDYNKEVK